MKASWLHLWLYRSIQGGKKTLRLVCVYDAGLALHFSSRLSDSMQCGMQNLATRKALCRDRHSAECQAENNGAISKGVGIFLRKGAFFFFVLYIFHFSGSAIRNYTHGHFRSFLLRRSTCPSLGN